MAEKEGFEIFVTTDQNVRHQQKNPEGVRLAIVALLSTAWPRLRLCTSEIRTALDEVRSDEFKVVPVPR